MNYPDDKKERQSDIPGFLGVIGIIALVIFSFYAAIRIDILKQERKKLHLHAVEKGYGEWKADSEGNVDFQWKTK